MTGVTIHQLRQQMANLAAALIANDAAYQNRVEWLEQKHSAGRLTGDLYSVKRADLLLADIGGAGRSIAVLVQAYAAIIQAELAYRARFEGEKTVDETSAVRGGTDSVCPVPDRVRGRRGDLE